jgi:TolB-like protein
VKKPRAPGPLRLAIVQFKNQGNEADLAFLSEGIGDTLSVKLAALPAKLKLIERNQIAQAMKEIEFGKTEWADRDTAIEIGRITGAEVVVLGGFQRASGKLRGVARFVSTENGEVLDARSADSAADQPFELQDAIAGQVRAAAEALAGQFQGK